MVYVIVAIALVFLTVKGYCGKKTSGYVESSKDALLFNLLRLIFCIVIGAVFVFFEGSQNFLKIEPAMLWICVLSGISGAAFLVGWLLAIQKNSMVSVDVGLTLGSIIPAVLCAFLFSEAILLVKMLGFSMIIIATVILASHSKKTVNGGIGGLLLLMFAAIGDGMSGFAQQLYRQYYTESGLHAHGVFYPKTVFHFYTYVFSALVLLIALVICYLFTCKQERKTNLSVPPAAVMHIFIMAVCLFAANYLQTVATSDFLMPSQVLYPIIKGGCLVTVNFTAMIFFKEKITLRSVIGSLIALSGIVFMTIGE